jgi:FkbM family methyltransferase
MSFDNSNLALDKEILFYRDITHKSRVVTLLRRIIRRLTRFLFIPAFEQISRFNDSVAKQLEQNITFNTRQELTNLEYFSKLEEAIAAFDTKIAGLNAIINQQSNQILENSDRINTFQKANPDFFNSFSKSEEWNKPTYSQSGEDAVLFYIFLCLGKRFEDCTYIDLGANHAKDMSNTSLIYELGGKGILVEANPHLIPELNFYRNRDTILNMIVSDISGNRETIHIMTGDGLSTVDSDIAQHILHINKSVSLSEVMELETITYNDIVEKYLGKTPDVLNIDIEGAEYKILKSIDYDNYRPLIIILEVIPYKPHLVVGEKETDEIDYLRERGYIEYAFTGINSILIDMQNPMLRKLYNHD